MTKAVNTSTEFMNKATNDTKQADALNIGRFAIVEHNGRLCYGLIDSVCLIGDKAVYGFITSWEDTWCSCLIDANRVTWCENDTHKAQAKAAVAYYITCEGESLKYSLDCAIAQKKESRRVQCEKQLAIINDLQKYLI